MHRHMKAVRRWFIYRRLVKELSDLPVTSLMDLGASRATIHDLAWHWARLEVERNSNGCAPTLASHSDYQM
jgi:hypothetical protein